MFLGTDINHKASAEAEGTEGTEAGQGGTLKLLWESTMRTNGEMEEKAKQD